MFVVISIYNILMFLNDDELNYKLGSIQNVGDVIDIFANLHILKDKSKIDEIRKDLFAYCHLDTLAMLIIFENLIKLAKKLNGHKGVSI